MQTPTTGSEESAHPSRVETEGALSSRVASLQLRLITASNDLALKDHRFVEWSVQLHGKASALGVDWARLGVHVREEVARVREATAEDTVYDALHGVIEATNGHGVGRLRRLVIRLWHRDQDGQQKRAEVTPSVPVMGLDDFASRVGGAGLDEGQRRAKCTPAYRAIEDKALDALRLRVVNALQALGTRVAPESEQKLVEAVGRIYVGKLERQVAEVERLIKDDSLRAMGKLASLFTSSNDNEAVRATQGRMAEAMQAIMGGSFANTANELPNSAQGIKLIQDLGLIPSGGDVVAAVQGAVDQCVNDFNSRLNGMAERSRRGAPGVRAESAEQDHTTSQVLADISQLRSGGMSGPQVYRELAKRYASDGERLRALNVVMRSRATTPGEAAHTRDPRYH